MKTETTFGKLKIGQVFSRDASVNATTYWKWTDSYAKSSFGNFGEFVDFSADEIVFSDGTMKLLGKLPAEQK